MRRDLVEQYALLPLVARFHGLQQRGLEIAGTAALHQRLHVLRETGAAVAATGIDERIADAAVGTDALAHVLDVHAEAVAEVGDLVHERDPRGQHRVGGVLGHLGITHAHEQHAVVVAQQRTIELGHAPARLLGIGAHDDAIGAAEVTHRRAFLEEFGVADHVEADARAARGQLLADRGAHLVGGAHRHGRLVDHDRVLAQVAPDVARHREHVAQVRRAVLARRRADRYEDVLGRAHRGGHVGAECQQPGLHRLLHHRLQARLENGDLAGLQARELGGVVVDAHHVIAHFREAGARDQAHVSRADDCYSHPGSFLAPLFAGPKSSGRTAACQIGPAGPDTGWRR